MSATLAQFFRYVWFMPSLGVRSPCWQTMLRNVGIRTFNPSQEWLSHVLTGIDTKYYWQVIVWKSGKFGEIASLWLTLYEQVDLKWFPSGFLMHHPLLSTNYKTEDQIRSKFRWNVIWQCSGVPEGTSHLEFCPKFLLYWLN